MPATAMSGKQVLEELEEFGTAQNRKVYRRYGIGENMYGVSYANLGKLAKRIKTDHELATALWGSGVHDARVLATMIADPQRITAAQVDGWANDLENYVLTDAYAGLVSKTPLAGKRMEKWTRSKGEWIGRAGWLLLARLAVSPDALTDADCQRHLDIIEAEIHSRKNRVKDAMNSALIAIGLRNPTFENKALAAAKRIGKVEVDHGETSCKTPDAAGYIQKAKQWKQRKRPS